jgi:diguanylate cyclase (GGDEF)-like protein
VNPGQSGSDDVVVAGTGTSVCEHRRPPFPSRTIIVTRAACAGGSTGTKTQLLLSDSATWIAVGLAGGAVAVALGLAVFVLLVLRRRPLGEAGRPNGTESQELAKALEDAREETRRARELADIAASVDLDSVLTRALETAAGLPGIDAGMIVLPQGNSTGDVKPIVATIGMSAEEAVRQPISGPPDGQAARAVRIAYRYTREETPGDDDLVRGGVSVPLRDEQAEPIGTLALFWRGRERDPAEGELALIEELAARAGPAIENARRFREARQLADFDALTNLHNRRYFHETLARECSRAHRYDRRLALVVFDVDDFKAINDRIGHLAGDAVLAAVAERVQSVVRSADIACRVGGDEFAVVLPESTIGDAEQLYRRVQFAVGARPLGPFERIHLSAGIAELRPEDDAKIFFERADEALYRAKETGKARFSAANGVS